MRPQASLKNAREFINAQGGQVATLGLSEEEINPSLQDDLSLRAYPLEQTTSCYPVQYSYPINSSDTEFRFFQDGKQRTIQIGFIPTRIGSHDILIPVHYFVVSAVILERSARRLKVWRNALLEDGIFIRKSLVPHQAALTAFESSGLPIVDITGEGGDYYDLRRRALREAKNRRLRAENNLISQWRQSEESESNFLVVDGTLMNFRNEDNVERCIGISKSFGSRYFEVGDHNRILQMNEFERSWAFRFHEEGEDTRRGARERISWYLRIRLGYNTDPEFGLIRVEISRRHLNHVTEYADRFSRSLISERLPTSYPAPRWDKHLYPIRECENYLNSLMPSTDTIRASMKG